MTPKRQRKRSDTLLALSKAQSESIRLRLLCFPAWGNMSKKAASANNTVEAKVGRRHSAADQTMLNSIAVQLEQLQQLVAALGANVQAMGNEEAAEVEPADDGTAVTATSAGIEAVDEATEVAATETPAQEANEAIIYTGATINDVPLVQIPAGNAPSSPLSKPPSVGGKHFNLNYVKRIGFSGDESLLAVKRVGRDEIKGYVALWGDAKSTDLEGEFFTPETDFWDRALGLPRALTWDHALDSTMKAPPVIGHIHEMGNDGIGRWYVAQLDRNHAYRRAIDALIDQGAVGTSSDSAPQYVVREPRGKSVWLKQWPLFAAALTTTPCEPRMLSEGSLVWKTVSEQLHLPDGTPPNGDGARLDDRQLGQWKRQVEILKLSV